MVARLHAQAVLTETTHYGGLWSLARGIAKNQIAYLEHLSNCHKPRGRGNLSESALAQLVEFLLEACLDQIKFSEHLCQSDRLANRIGVWAEEEARTGGLSVQAVTVLKALMPQGTLPRGQVAHLLGISSRHARRTIALLLRRRIVKSANARAPLEINFPVELSHRWFPELLPEPGLWR
jgi:Fic family protein